MYDNNKIGFDFDRPISPSIPTTGARRKRKKKEENELNKHLGLPSAFKQPFAADSDRAKDMTRATGMFTATDMSPFSVVEKNRVFSAPFEHSCTTL